ncbi:MAG: hypothetical protein J4G10_05385 [Alphaproteobacteria bacterium]|nr:hypothetical protein [Alphaproteobacteria bacterium]
MPRLHKTQTNFTSGELSPLLLGRGDLRAYENGAAKLRNTFIFPTGGLRRRAGLRFIDAAQGTGRLVSFEFNTEQVYLLVFTDSRVDIYRDGQWVAEITATPWTEAMLPQINWTQSADTLLVVHPETTPRKITRTSDTSWSIDTWSYVTDSGSTHQPYFKFADDSIQLQPSATTGSITLTATGNVFVTGHEGTLFRLEGKEVLISTVTTATQANAVVQETLTSTSATKDWDEQTFSPVHGHPVSVAFHQDRLVIGGSRDLPNRLWMSKSSDLFNFDTGTGLDDEAIEFAILSDQVNAIRSVFSGRHLQVFTSGAEWMVTGDPLTPTTVQLRRQTRIGSPIDRTLPPINVDGATLFLARNEKEIREFLFTDIEQAYQANDLALLSQHLMNAPVDQDFDPSQRLVHIVMGDGTIATVTAFRTEQVTAWTRQETDGNFLSVAVVGNDAYVLVARDGQYRIELFDESVHTDSALTGTNGTPTVQWSGLDHLEGKTVKVIADGILRDDAVVTSGSVTLGEPATSVEIGLPYTHTIEPLPPVFDSRSGSRPNVTLRLIEATFRLHATQALRVDTGKGAKELPFKTLGPSGVLDSAPAVFTGNKRVRTLGWKSEGTKGLWRIEQDTPYPFTLLSVTTEIMVND